MRPALRLGAGPDQGEHEGEGQETLRVSGGGGTLPSVGSSHEVSPVSVLYLVEWSGQAAYKPLE